jgi:thiol-disulfide isomerase/thioredoxin
MRFPFAVLLLLLAPGCQQRSSPNPVERDKVGLNSPAPGDPEYVAEDPRLAQFVGQPGPDLTLQMIDGAKIDLGSLYRTKPVYLKLWASYCIPCRAQMPGFERIYETFGDRIEVIAVNAGVGDDVAKVRTFMQKANLRMPSAIDDGALGDWIKLQETPLHIIVGRDGRVLHASHRDGIQLDAAIAKAIAAPTGIGPVHAAKVANVVQLRPGDAVPAIALRSSHDQPMRIHAGVAPRPRAILFTSVWCESYLKETEPETVPRCRRAREEADRLATTSEVEWLGVVSHLWTDPEALASYEAEFKPRIAMAIDTDGMAFRAFGIRRFPAVALIDSNGRLVRIVGPDGSGDIEAALRASVKQQRQARNTARRR